MITLQLGTGETVHRIFCGFITTESDLARFTDDIRKELASHKSRGEPLLVEAWEYDKHGLSKRKWFPKQNHELAACKET